MVTVHSVSYHLFCLSVPFRRFNVHFLKGEAVFSQTVPGLYPMNITDPLIISCSRYCWERPRKCSTCTDLAQAASRWEKCSWNQIQFHGPDLCSHGIWYVFPLLFGIHQHVVDIKYKIIVKIYGRYRVTFILHILSKDIILYKEQVLILCTMILAKEFVQEIGISWYIFHGHWRRACILLVLSGECYKCQ